MFREYAAYFLIALLAITFTATLFFFPGEYFRDFFGEKNPILVIGVTAIIGAITLWLLQSRFGFVIFRGKETLRGIAFSAAIATGFAALIVIADFIIRYPQDINVPVPQALLFYPAIAFVVEVLFHLLPLALLLLTFSVVNQLLGRERLVWAAILCVAAIEPTYQLLFVGEIFTWGSTYTWAHIFGISLLQLYIFRRYDFVSMLAFRLIYYAYWHILWGTARLNLLF